VDEGSLLRSILGPSDTRLPLHSEPDQCPRPDGNSADLMSSFVPSRFTAALPFARDEHFPATPLSHYATFRHPASYLTWFGQGKVGAARASPGATFLADVERSPTSTFIRQLAAGARGVFDGLS
jgi:hypothetical protein